MGTVLRVLMQVRYVSGQEIQLSLKQTARRIYAVRNDVTDPPKTRLSPYVLPRQIWSFYVKGCRLKLGENPDNWGAQGPRLLG